MWGLQNLANKLGTSLSLSQSSITSSDALVPNMVARSPASLSLAGSMLLSRSSFEKLDATGVEADVVSWFTSSLSTTYEQLLDLMVAGKQERSPDRLDERFLVGHKRLFPPSLPFLPEGLQVMGEPLFFPRLPPSQV